MNAPDHINPEQLLSILFQSPNATAVYTGSDIKILSANAAMLKFWGKDRSVIGKNFTDAIPELIDQPFPDILREVWNSGITYYAKNHPATLEVNGELQEFYFDFEYKAILDEKGKTKFILHTAFEVSERMAAQKLVLEKSVSEQKLNEELSAINEEYTATNEELSSTNEELMTAEESLIKLIAELHDKEKRFRFMIEQSPVAMASLKGENLIVDIVNDIVLNIWGKNQSVVGMTLPEALPELEGQPFLGILKKVYKTGKPFYGNELKVSLSHNGNLTDRYLNFVYHRTNVDGAEEHSILIVANDVTEQVLARKNVDEINTRLEIALDASSLGSTEVHLATGVMKSNDQFKRNFGFEPEEEFVYADLFEAMFPEYREKVKALVKESIRTNGIYKAEYPIKWRDGSTHWIQAHGRPRYDENGKGDRMVGMTLDITDKKLFEQQKDDFLSIASHELKTPITVVKACLQFLYRIKDQPFSDTHTRMIEQSVKHIDKMAEMVDDLLNIRRLSEGQLQIEKKHFNLYDLLSNTCNHIKLENKYKLIIQGEQPLDVFADEHRIEQVVINFVNNAVKYAPESYEIIITIESEGEYVKVSVKDFGKGVEKEELPKLFDRYYRKDHSGKGYSGLGLGLYICSQIIEKHKGEIGAESVLNEGSTFWFKIPISEPII